MNSLTRNIFRQLKPLRNQRQWSVNAASRVSNEEYVIRSPLSDIVIPDTTVVERLWKYSSGFLNHVAVECAETKKAYTYKQLQDFSSAFATSLIKKFGLRSQDIVSVMLPNCPEFPVVVVGTLQSGCILTTVNPIYKEYEITHQFATTQPKVVVTIKECYEVIVKSLQSAKINAKIVIVDKADIPIPDGTIRFSEVAEKAEIDYSLLNKIVPNKDDVACIPFSSGTTGLPKGVDLTYRNFLAAMEILAHEKICYPIRATDSFQDIVPCVLPFFHVYGFAIVLLGHLTTGCKLVTMSKFSASLYFDILKDYKSTLLYIVPPIATLLSKHPDVNYEHLKHVRYISCGAAPLAGSDVEPLLEKCKGKASISQGFGATETMAITTGTIIGSNVDLSAAGEPMSNIELKFVSTETGQPLPIGEQGELYVRGPTVMKGYHKNEKATKESLTEDGYFKTGDLGYYKPGSGLYINDRIKELIKVKGLQVAPAELEGLLRSHPSVADAAVIGVPHAFNGETPKAFVIPKLGAKPTPEEIQDFVSSKVASYKKIEEVQFVESIPKNASGKILRRELKQMYA